MALAWTQPPDQQRTTGACQPTPQTPVRPGDAQYGGIRARTRPHSPPPPRFMPTRITQVMSERHRRRFYWFRKRLERQYHDMVKVGDTLSPTSLLDWPAQVSRPFFARVGGPELTSRFPLFPSSVRKELQIDQTPRVLLRQTLDLCQKISAQRCPKAVLRIDISAHFEHATPRSDRHSPHCGCEYSENPRSMAI